MADIRVRVPEALADELVVDSVARSSPPVRTDAGSFVMAVEIVGLVANGFTIVVSALAVSLLANRIQRFAQRTGETQTQPDGAPGDHVLRIISPTGTSIEIPTDDPALESIVRTALSEGSAGGGA